MYTFCVSALRANAEKTVLVQPPNVLKSKEMCSLVQLRFRLSIMVHKHCYNKIRVVQFL